MTDSHKKLKKQYHGVYYPVPLLREKQRGYRFFFDAARTRLMYEGADPDISRLLYNLKGKELVPMGETMETMP
jgi:hypothetical protein